MVDAVYQNLRAGSIFRGSVELSPWYLIGNVNNCWYSNIRYSWQRRDQSSGQSKWVRSDVWLCSLVSNIYRLSENELIFTLRNNQTDIYNSFPYSTLISSSFQPVSHCGTSHTNLLFQRHPLPPTHTMNQNVKFEK